MGDDDQVRGGSAGQPRRRRSAPSRRTGRRAGAKTGRAGQHDETKELTLRSRSMFLRDVQRQLGRPELYNLEDEFAKTKRNRSPVVVLSVTLFVVVMVAAGIAVTTYIQQRSQNVPVNISAFQDVNLMELLNRAKQLDDQMTAATRNLQALQNNQSNEISTIHENEAQQVQIIDNEMIGETAKRARIADVRARAQGRIQQIQAKYIAPIKKAKDEIANLQSQAAQYDTRQMQEAKKQQEILNNQQKLFDMQMKQTEDYYNKQLAGAADQYKAQVASINQHNTKLIDLLKQNHAAEIASLIAKYNPTFTAPALTALINEPIASDPVGDPTGDPFIKMALQAGVVKASTVTDLQKRMNDFAALLGALQKVPYENSVPPALAHIGYFNRRIADDYRAIGKGMTEIVAERDRQIQQLKGEVKHAEQVIAERDATIGEYNQALSALVRTSRENGYILDARDPSKIAVFIDPLYRVRTGDTAYVFRRDDQRIGTIEFTVSAGKITAKQLTLANEKTPMEPFDKILLNLK